MSIETQLKALDKLVSKGKVMDAFEIFFHDNVITFSSDKDKTNSKKEKRNLLKAFFENITSIDQVKFHDHIKDGSHTYSKFTFIFTNKQNERLKWHEVIRRKWKGDQVIEEYYYHEKFSKLKERLETKKEAGKSKKKKSNSKKESSKKESKPSSKGKALVLKGLPSKPNTTNTTAASNTIVPPKAKKDKPAAKTRSATEEKKVVKKPEVKKQVAAKSPTVDKPASKKPTAVNETTNKAPTVKTAVTKPLVKKPSPVKVPTRKAPVTKKTVAKPVVAKSPITKVPTPRKARVKKAPDLTIVEGIGPKIKELLGLGGIKTFAQLASADVASMKALLLKKGGTRYNIHDPATWPEQSALARDGKWEELEQLKKELKGGKR